MYLHEFLALATTFIINALAAPAPPLKKLRLPAPFDDTASLDPRASNPNDSSGSSLLKRTTGGVTLSDGVNFTGNVWYGDYPVDTCVALNG